MSACDELRAELDRLRDGSPQHDLARCSWWEWRRKAWLQGVQITREVVAERLDPIYRRLVADELSREGEWLAARFEEENP